MAHNIQPGFRICPASPHGGNCIIRTPTRRRHVEAKLLMLQNPHRSQPEVHHAASKTGAVPVGTKKTRPASAKTPNFGCFERAGRTFSRSRTPSGHAGRTFSRTRRNNMGTLKPTTPLRTPNKEALKPASPLHPKNAPKTPISHPQRRRRFQSRLGRRPQRRHRFQSQTDTSEQRRHRFQESGPPGLQDPYAIPVAGGGAWPGFETRHRAKRGCLVSRAAGASGAWNTSGTTSNTINEASRRPLAHQAPLV